MKQDIHPQVLNACFEDVSTGKKFLTKSTLKARHGKTITIDGVEYQHHICDITSASHPIFTGEQRLVDTEGRVEKFKNKYRRRGKA